MLLKVLCKVNCVLSGTDVTPLVFLETFLTMFDSKISVGAEADDDRIQLLLSEVKGKDITELIASGREKLASVPSGGGDAVAVTSYGGGATAAAPAAAEPKKEEKVEDKEESDDVSFYPLNHIVAGILRFDISFRPATYVISVLLASYMVI
ncbi:hypothetical protein TEA_028409 [Camellia sinensis var. sinensis]|uniref:60S acidic ribosomal protein P2 n=1 Tax=Camellia sinensis var. sinensis TaxID=542762 RepID=A0A4S4D6Z0_CAMSN|nr:hypothetical protein TEA_028409 [Camellia sinensis var. sinensis]